MEALIQEEVAAMALLIHLQLLSLYSLSMDKSRGEGEWENGRRWRWALLCTSDGGVGLPRNLPHQISWSVLAVESTAFLRLNRLEPVGGGGASRKGQGAEEERPRVAMTTAEESAEVAEMVNVEGA